MPEPPRPPKPLYSEHFAGLARALRRPVVSHIPRTVLPPKHTIENVPLRHKTIDGREIVGHVIEVGSGWLADQLLEFPMGHQQRLEGIGIAPRILSIQHKDRRCCLKIEKYKPTSSGKVEITATDENGQKHLFYVIPGELIQ